MRLTLAAFALLATLAPAQAEIVVTVAPQRPVSDLYYRSSSERDALIRDLAHLLRKLGRDRLPTGQSLSVELIDVRPAGRIDPFAGPSGVRVLSAVTPPTVRLRYALKDRGRAIARGEELVSDINYLDDISARSSLASFPYERALIRDWFRDRIVTLKPQPR
ncbi:DUF3016 domain-containing protein [Methylopila sp. M107]|uniref:DUF3016 domain-containing protein n=1 Tax=Methylopila sp. M107 TaxID=1101190 RepID=UPI00035D24DF|nr:DUF3016 domain-containing protein [Methylopila sp. M107]